MNERASSEERGELPQNSLSRRDFVRLLGLLASLGVMDAASLIGCAPQPPALATPTQAAPLPAATSAVLPTVATAGERVPELTVWYINAYPWMTEWWRKIVLDAQKIGLSYKVNGVAQSAMLAQLNAHTFGHLVFHQNDPMPYRDNDPTEMVVNRMDSRFTPKDMQNFGEYANPEVDKLAQIVLTALDPEKRREAVGKIQDIMARDYYYWCSCNGPLPIYAYNSADWDGVVNTEGAGVGGLGYIWNWISVRPKTSRKRLVMTIGQLDVASLTSPWTSSGVRHQNQLYWDKFLMLDKDLKVVPWVVASWKIVDDLTWDLTIRDGLKWHDGRPATAEDAAFTFNYIAKWKPAHYASVASTIISAQALDARTVRLKTSEPAANMTSDLLIRTPFLPKHIWENAVESQKVKDPSAVKVSPEMIIGTGPFKFDHLTPDVEMLLKANKDHWMAPQIDEFLLILVPNVDSILGKMESKEVDFEELVLTPTQADRLKSLKHITVLESDRSLNPFLIPFMPNLPWKDPVFRKAWHRTLDKDYLVKVAWEGAGSVLPFNSLMGPKHPFFNPNIKERFNYNLDEAKQILAAGGYSWDKEGRLLYPGPENADFKKRTDHVFNDA